MSLITPDQQIIHLTFTILVQNVNKRFLQIELNFIAKAGAVHITRSHRVRWSFQLATLH